MPTLSNLIIFTYKFYHFLAKKSTFNFIPIPHSPSYFSSSSVSFFSARTNLLFRQDINSLFSLVPPSFKIYLAYSRRLTSFFAFNIFSFWSSPKMLLATQARFVSEPRSQKGLKPFLFKFVVSFNLLLQLMPHAGKKQ